MSKESITKDIALEKVEEAEEAKVATPSNIYQVLMADMTPQKLATLGVKLISVNNSSLYWVTTAGQLYEFNSYDNAVQAEFAWLMSEPGKASE